MIPPDFGTFWAQAAQQGFNPKVATIGKALLFPSAIEALGTARCRPYFRDLVVTKPSVQLVAERHIGG